MRVYCGYLSSARIRFVWPTPRHQAAMCRVSASVSRIRSVASRIRANYGPIRDVGE